ncbi:M15 family metallopeptidase [Pedobacter sp. ASV12]|uniref:M15 family metallopeptidase n=1 Tax=Pedobacter sp. ASV12 TaxID=2795120 RepID=UPI0018EC9326|nr:M15 family metallopeptidase [Pedobacter sp. ASV12]
MLRNDKSAEAPRWATIINIISVALIPIVLGVGGWLLQRSIQDQSIRRDYVQLAVSILKTGDTTKANAGLRGWAVKLLNENSTVKFSESVQQQLKSGDVSLANNVEISPEEQKTQLNLETLNPQVKILATRLIEIAKGKGLQVVVYKAYWSQKEQDENYAIGRTKPGSIITFEKISPHTKGLAFDVYLIRNGREVDDDYSFNIIGSIGRNLGLTWRGELKNGYQNKAHFELN